MNQPDPMQTRAKFTLELTLAQAVGAQEALEQAGIPFEPEEAMTVSDPDDDTYWVMNSSELPELLSKINDYLEENGHPGRVPEPDGLVETEQALRLAYWEWEWRKYRVDEALWNDWDAVENKYPDLLARRR